MRRGLTWALAGLLGGGGCFVDESTPSEGEDETSGSVTSASPSTSSTTSGSTVGTTTEPGSTASSEATTATTDEPASSTTEPVPGSTTTGPASSTSSSTTGPSNAFDACEAVGIRFPEPQPVIGDDAWVIEFCDNTFLQAPVAVIDGPAPVAYEGSSLPAPQGMYCYEFNIGFSLSGNSVDLSIVAEGNEIAKCTFVPPPA